MSEITKEALEASMLDLDLLQKSLEASEKGELLSKSLTAEGEDLEKSGEGKDQEKGSADKTLSKAAKKDKAKDEDEDEEDDEEDNDKKDKMEFSHAGDGESDLIKSFEEDGNLKKAIDVSDFLKSLVDRTTDTIGSMDNRLSKSFGYLFEIAKKQNDVIKSLATNVENLQKALSGLRGIPAVLPRSAGVTPLARGGDDINKGGPGRRTPEMLRKGILSSMSKAVQEGSLDSLSLIKFETTGELSEDLQSRFLETK